MEPLDPPKPRSRRFVTRRAVVGLDEILAPRIDAEKLRRLLHSDSETIRAILHDYFKLPQKWRRR